MMTAPPEFFRLIDLNGVPLPEFVKQIDYEEIFRGALDFYLGINPDHTALLESDPVFKVIEAFAYREMLIRQEVQDTALENTITKASRNGLQVIGAPFGVVPFEGEDVERLRHRVQLGVYSAAVGGPRGSYEFRALSAHPDVVNVSVESPEAGEIAVTVLAFEEVEASTVSAEALAIGKALFPQPAGTGRARILAAGDSAPLKAVRAAVGPNDVRPLTDSVAVQPPRVLPFTISARLVIYPGPEATAVRNNALSSLAVFLQSIRKVGYDANKAGIIAALKVGGVQNVIVDAPMMDVEAGPFDLPVCVAVSVEVIRVDA